MLWQLSFIFAYSSYKDLTAIQFVSIYAIGMFGFGFFNLVIWAFVTDVIDYHEYLTGLREDRNRLFYLFNGS